MVTVLSVVLIDWYMPSVSIAGYNYQGLDLTFKRLTGSTLRDMLNRSTQDYRPDEPGKSYVTTSFIPPCRYNNVKKKAGGDRKLDSKVAAPCREFKKRSPSALIIGEKKCGTTVLAIFLGYLNPHIKLVPCELHFFDSNGLYDKGVGFYREMFPRSCPDHVVLEKTPRYFRHPEAMDRIFAWNQHVRVVLSLRDPIQRAVSEFYFEVEQQLSRTRIPPENAFASEYSNFEEMAIDKDTLQVNSSVGPIVRSLYNIPLRRWLAKFTSEQIHIVDADAMQHSNPATELQKVERFFRVKSVITESMFVMNSTKEFYCVKGQPCIAIRGHVHPPLAESVVRKLTDFFKPHVMELYQQIGYKLSWMDAYLS